MFVLDCKYYIGLICCIWLCAVFDCYAVFDCNAVCDCNCCILQYNVRVTTMDAELEFAIQTSTTGKQLFDQVS